MTPNKPRTALTKTIGMLLAGSLVLLGACSDDTSSANHGKETAITGKAPQNTPASQGSGVIETSAGRFEFTPTRCIIHVEDGVYDIEIAGAGKSPEGEKIYVDFSSTGNELSIDLGVDTQFASSDRRLVAGRHVTSAMDIQVDNDEVRVPELLLRDFDTQNLSGSLLVKCR